MSLKFEEAVDRAYALNAEITRFLKDAQYDLYDDLSGIDYDRDDLDDSQVIDELRYCAEKLDDVRRTLNYLRLPIVEVSQLHLNEGGRYETDDGFVYTSGTAIEALIRDEYHDRPYWVVSRVESSDEGYYIVDYSRFSMDGLLVRRRRN